MNLRNHVFIPQLSYNNDVTVSTNQNFFFLRTCLRIVRTIRSAFYDNCMIKMYTTFFFMGGEVLERESEVANAALKE
jgi:hypothetical protein